MSHSKTFLRPRSCIKPRILSVSTGLLRCCVRSLRPAVVGQQISPVRISAKAAGVLHLWCLRRYKKVNIRDEWVFSLVTEVFYSSYHVAAPPETHDAAAGVLQVSRWKS